MTHIKKEYGIKIVENNNTKIHNYDTRSEAEEAQYDWQKDLTHAQVTLVVRTLIVGNWEDTQHQTYQSAHSNEETHEIPETLQNAVNKLVERF